MSSYKKGRTTISKYDCECTTCNKTIHKGDTIYIIPGKSVEHIKCHNNASS